MGQVFHTSLALWVALTAEFPKSQTRSPEPDLGFMVPKSQTRAPEPLQLQFWALGSLGRDAAAGIDESSSGSFGVLVFRI